MGSLTDLAVTKAAAGGGRREIPDGESGLYLVVQPSGAKSWAVRYRFDGVPRKVTVGSYPGVSLKAARATAKQLQGKIASGLDPGSEKKTDKERAKALAAAKKSAEKDRVELVVEQFIERYAKKQNRSWEETARILRTEVAGPLREKKPPPPWNGKALPAITKRDVHELLDSVVDRGAPIMANRVFAALRRMCGWAVERGILTTSPCDGLKAPAPERSRDRILSEEEIRLAWKACDEIGWPYGPVVKTLILTAQRREEVAGMRWAEVDLDAKTWTIPKERAKNNIEHVVALSDQALAILKDLPRIKDGKKDSPLVFSGNGKVPVNGFSKSKEEIDAKILKALREAKEDAEALPRWTLHDLRRTATSGMARLGIAPHVADAVLNHKSGAIKGVAAVYNRYRYEPEKAAALATWGRFVDALVTGGPATNVVELASVKLQ
jgi:integrase